MTFVPVKLNNQNNNVNSEGTSIEYIGEFSANPTTATSIDFTSGTYARADYSELTVDNFIVIPVRSEDSYAVVGPTDGVAARSGSSMASWLYSYSTKKITYSNGLLSFNGGYSAKVSNNYDVRSISLSNNYKVYIIKPGLSTFQS